ncbi:type VII secretion protein EsaA [Bacillus swezeyi]|uniref:Type VII secretion protein EsaA n=1 Tax=Bacillus swezeyi TaxID=1925020 RepID=A0A5M8RUG3_9BACI|nr:type VII secretion protein EsaA [Bacillus swezeyi]KAA6450484.1 type VII secretion protein EsaA [Bacillus swezeyi]TYS37020.1 type VII secretion protein EsaA [Bacillus swezeyi]
MTAQQKSSLKIISAMVIIILLPVLFFHFIGENPTKKVSNATREIAVVNEDMGFEKNGEDETGDEKVFFGRDVAAILADRPDYEWTVVGRSAAESGLAERKYDAIVYIPSDFSKNILSYNEDRPQKAVLEFSIQDRLDAVNKEKVQRELQQAQKTMSKQMSSLYWDFVKQEVKNVRTEFDNIVDKESEFQNAMYNFYKPSSNDLAGEVNRQKEMIDSLKESINETQGTSKDRNASVEETKKQLDGFVDNVNQYKKYQQEQAELLQAAQADNEKQIQTGLQSIDDKQDSAASRFSERMSGMTTAFGSLQTQFGLAASSNEDLQEYRYKVPGQQFEVINTIENQLINVYHAQKREYDLDQIQLKMIKERSNLTENSSDTTDPGDDEDQNDDDDKHDDTEQPKDLEIDLKEQQDELKSVAAELKELSDGLKESPDNGSGNPGDDDPASGEPDQNQDQDQDSNQDQELNQEQNQDQNQGSEQTEDQNQPTAETTENGREEDSQTSDDQTNDPGTGDDGQTQEPGGETPTEQPDDVAKLKEQLNNAADRVEKVEEDLRTKQETHNEELKKQLDKFEDKIKNLNKTIGVLTEKIAKVEDARTEDFKKIYEKIENEESKIIKFLDGNPRQDKLKETFDSKIKTRDVEKLLNYYSYLSVYEATLSGSLIPESSVKQSAIASQKDQVDTVLRISEDENTKWGNLKNNMMATSEDIEAYTSGMADFVDSYGAFIDEKQTEILDELGTISERANAVTDQLSNPAGAGTPVLEGDATDGSMVISMQDTLGSDILNLSDMLGSLSDHQSGVIEYTNNIQESVNDVQKKADTLNSNWGKNVNSTKLVRGDVYGILGNAFGGNDRYVYDYLANPVKISGDVPESKAQNVPPVVILVIVMISSLLIGYFSHYYQNAPLLVRGALFGILNIIVGLMISLFGLNIYSLADDQAVMWSAFTIMLLVSSSAIIRTAFMLGSIAGGAVTAAMILFYVAPLLDLAMPNFSFENPVSAVYVSIQYGTGSQFALGIGALILITIIAAAVPFIVDFAKSRTEESENDHDA